MEAKIEKISELSKLLSVKTRMSDDYYRAKAPHIWCEGLAQHVRRAYNITRIGKTVANV